MQASKLNKENNDVVFKMEFTAEEFENAQIEVYKKTKDNFTIDGFRKGKAPRKLIEQHYGSNIFMEDAVNELMSDAYPKALEELDINPIDQPRIVYDEMKKGQSFSATITVTEEPEYEIKDYKGVKIKDIVHEMKEEDIDKEIEAARKRNARLVAVDRKAENGDSLIIDYSGFVGEDQFEGGTAENQTLVLGSGQFIPGFEEQLIGTSVGDEVDVKVTFPEEYHSEELKGAEAVFHVKVHEIKMEELPDLDDDFAQDVSEFDTLDELKNDIRVELEKAAVEKSLVEKKNSVLEKVFNANEMEIPQVMIESEIDQMFNEMAQQLQQQGMDIGQYMQFLGKEPADFREDLRADAEKRVKTKLLVKSVAKQENIDATDTEVDTEIENMAKMYGMEIDQLKGMLAGQLDMIKSDIKNRKAVDFMFENAVIEE